jgi:F-type H+-transporting ATPase subunit alpha
MRQVAGRLRLDLAQYRELAAFAQFASDLDKRTRDQLERGKRMTELLKQGQFEPMPIPQQAMILFAGTNGYLDDVAVEQVRAFEKELLQFLSSSHSELEKAIAKDRAISEETEKKLRSAIDEYRKGSALVEREKPKPKGEEKEAAAAGGPLERARAAKTREQKKES